MLLRSKVERVIRGVDPAKQPLAESQGLLRSGASDNRWLSNTHQVFDQSRTTQASLVPARGPTPSREGWGRPPFRLISSDGGALRLPSPPANGTGPIGLILHNGPATVTLLARLNPRRQARSQAEPPHPRWRRLDRACRLRV